ncbi:NAD(P)-binding protein [Exidia glandulosa HHB12029]|uniref:NAD(P)-binding protein n=1 Tax=Exidia glandulosa HHB12029 TaxID=1314781 RepID=A0A165FBW1_EXIGL|nr:NAD(P)-binding protein [Exidia glandulosa HHB12029]
MGKALAKELVSRGFDVLIHGRNMTKLAAVRDELRLAVSESNRDVDVKVWCADASAGRWYPAELLALTEGPDIAVVVLVNGGTDIKSYAIDGQTDDEIHSVMSLNFFFSVFVTRTLLPALRSTAARGPVSVLAVGSHVALIPPPYLSVYSASKNALQSVMHGIAADERFAGRNVDGNLDSKYLQVGSVHTASNKGKPTLARPTSEAFVKDVLRRMTAPGRIVAPNLVHGISVWVIMLLPERLAERLAGRQMVEAWGETVTGGKSRAACASTSS